MLNKKRQGLIFVISGPSGSGKTTLVAKLLQRKKIKGFLTRPVSFTTRLPRRGERNGQDYFFISKKEFQKKKSDGEFLEWTKYIDTYYATSKKFIQEKLEQKKNTILLIDIRGAFHVRKLFPRSTVLIFILPPSSKVLKTRLKTRSSEDAKNFEQRLRIAKEEIKLAKRYNYTVVNRDLKMAVDELTSIIHKESEKEGDNYGTRIFRETFR